MKNIVIVLFVSFLTAQLVGCVETIENITTGAKKLKEANDARIAAQEALKKEQQAIKRLYAED